VGPLAGAILIDAAGVPLSARETDLFGEGLDDPLGRMVRPI